MFVVDVAVTLSCHVDVAVVDSSLPVRVVSIAVACLLHF